ncbi:hypothetical protein SKAU_G00058580 [Synaphobranchus kaupii]|uniref:Uncharacterized protein n=1 Tax=Synaphobranchus kaupii TaxID=118154 RepID=A0A9Q1G4C8_SYNKA|nr:hypothetical protein SKAU_G00058580 [Synaphobranchus kaupii]
MNTTVRLLARVRKISALLLEVKRVHPRRAAQRHPAIAEAIFCTNGRGPLDKTITDYKEDTYTHRITIPGGISYECRLDDNVIGHTQALLKFNLISVLQGDWGEYSTLDLASGYCSWN